MPFQRQAGFRDPRAARKRSPRHAVRAGPDHLELIGPFAAGDSGTRLANAMSANTGVPMAKQNRRPRDYDNVGPLSIEGVEASDLPDKGRGNVDQNIGKAL